MILNSILVFAFCPPLCRRKRSAAKIVDDVWDRPVIQSNVRATDIRKIEQGHMVGVILIIYIQVVVVVCVRGGCERCSTPFFPVLWRLFLQ
jgi:hypothetical protein